MLCFLAQFLICLALCLFLIEYTMSFLYLEFVKKMPTYLDFFFVRIEMILHCESFVHTDSNSCSFRLYLVNMAYNEMALLNLILIPPIRVEYFFTSYLIKLLRALQLTLLSTGWSHLFCQVHFSTRTNVLLTSVSESFLIISFPALWVTFSFTRTSTPRFFFIYYLCLFSSIAVFHKSLYSLVCF